MNWQVNDGLDGRYFGLTSTDQSSAAPSPSWTDGDGDGPMNGAQPTR